MSGKEALTLFKSFQYVNTLNILIAQFITFSSKWGIDRKV